MTNIKEAGRQEKRSAFSFDKLKGTLPKRPRKRREFLAEFNKVIPLVKKEQGCLEYGPAVDTPTDITAQCPLRDHVVTVVEKWESLEALNDHLTAPHMTEYRMRVRPFVTGTQLQVLKPV